MSSDERFRSGDLAELAGISPSLVRFYEQVGFIPPAERTASGQRTFRDRHRDALLASRAAIDGYGWRNALKVMRDVHTGNATEVFAQVDAHHARLDRMRAETRETIDLLAPLLTLELMDLPARNVMSIGEAATWLEVSLPTLRFWESQDLVQPDRDPGSRYRIYDRDDQITLRVIATLRSANYSIVQIREVIVELRERRPEAAMRTIEQRMHALDVQSAACAKATTAIVSYMSKWANP